MNDNKLKCWLLQAGFKVSDPLQTDINRVLPNGTTPLMHAARMGDVEAVKGLLARGADPTLMNADSNGALWFACFANSEACASRAHRGRCAARQPERQWCHRADLLRLGGQDTAGSATVGCRCEPGTDDAG